LEKPPEGVTHLLTVVALLVIGAAPKISNNLIGDTKKEERE